MTTYYSSDPHYGHANIIKYCKRPFADVEAMNREMLRIWNATVKPFDTVYLLGDFAFGPKPFVKDYAGKLNGNVTLVKGNHDRGISTMLEAGFKVVVDHMTIQDEVAGEKVRVFLRHFPPSAPNWPLTKEADYFLCGHVHDAWARRGRALNVGVDVCDFLPMTLDQLLARPFRVGDYRDDQCYTCGHVLSKTDGSCATHGSATTPPGAKE